MILHKSKYVEIILEPENSLIIDKFLSETDKMSVQEFKDEMNIFVGMCEKYQPKRELVYLKDMQFSIGVNEQEWMNKEIFPKYKNIIKRMAFLVPSDFIAKLAVEQTMEEEVGVSFFQKYFDDEIEARIWLLKE